MSEERRLAILGAIVQDYVLTSEPIGSKALLARHRLGVSAATVRNEMALLEEEGLITAPHTSAGRIPTDAGYRLFVDRLAQVKPLSSAERAAIRRFLDGAVDLDDVVQRTVRLLSSLTHQVAVMQYPSLSRSAVRHVELVPLGGTRLMVVLIVSTGRVEQRVVETGCPLLGDAGTELVHRCRARLNAEVGGKLLQAAPPLLAELVAGLDDDERAVLAPVCAALADALQEESEERVAFAGAANLARLSSDFPEQVGSVLEALEEHVVLLRLMGAAAAEDRVNVRIGGENPHEAFHVTSVVSTNYSDAGSLGVIGPTRMDYPTAMAHVRAVARYVTEILES